MKQPFDFKGRTPAPAELPTSGMTFSVMWAGGTADTRVQAVTSKGDQIAQLIVAASVVLESA
jgi:environmental stress-induced protein Ves